MKCLPASKLPQANGVAVHDWHAEILALRAFNYFVLQECQRLAAAGDERITSSEFLRRRTSSGVSSPSSSSFWHSQPFTWREDVTLHMYCSEAPCKIHPSPIKLFSPNLLTPNSRRRRKHGTNNGLPTRRLALDHPLAQSHHTATNPSKPRRSLLTSITSHSNSNGNPNPNPPRQRLLLPAGHSPSKTQQRRRPALALKVLLGQDRPEAMHLPAMLARLPSRLPP